MDEPAAAERGSGRRDPVLVFDAGSASLHLRVLDADDTVVASADLGAPAGPDTEHALREVLAQAPDIAAVGHRFVHGGPALSDARRVDDAVRAELDRVAALAPLHLPPALAGLDLARRLLPEAPQVACFDTAFHAGLPQRARTYAIPRLWRERYGLRRYGFHGLSYAWAAARAARLLGRPLDELHLVLTHLGGGCSACALREGRSVDTTMGFTPLEGMAMTRRSGSVDPGALLWLQTEHGMSPDELVDALNHRSGLLGLADGLSEDTRDLVKARDAGDPRAGVALDVFTHRARRSIAAVAASLDRVDALVFTGDIGEDQPEARAEICAGLRVLGVDGDLTMSNPATDAVISPPEALVPVLLVHTGEIRQIAAETRAALR